MRKERLSELDVLRAVAAVAVVLIHITADPMVTAPHTSWWWVLASSINQLARFSIPAFVLMTGIALFYTYGDRTDFSMADFYKRRVTVIGVPYVAWTILYMLFVAGYSHNWAHASVGNVLRAIGQGTGMYQLYYVLIAFQFYLLFPLIRPLLRSRWLPSVVIATILVQGILMYQTLYGLPGLNWLNQVPMRDRLFPWWAGYFALGMWISADPRKFLQLCDRFRWLLTVVSAGLLTYMMVEYLHYMSLPGYSAGWAASGFRPSAYLFALACILAILGFAGRWLNWGAWFKQAVLSLGTYSFGIYLVHPLVLTLVGRVAPRLHLSPLPYFVLTLVTVMVGSYVVTRLIAATPLAPWLVGVAAPKKVAKPPVSRGLSA